MTNNPDLTLAKVFSWNIRLRVLKHCVMANRKVGVTES